MKGEKITKYGELNKFTVCHESPLPGKEFCLEHSHNSEAPIVERLDTGIITRQKRKELGIDIDKLTEEGACRKRENINTRTGRSHTAGLLYAYRSCGISLGHIECIHAGK